jgi:hypothetical protein
MALANIIELRQLLRDKFPGLRTRADELGRRAGPCWATGLPQFDVPLGGGFLHGALSEIVSESRTAGTASLLRHFIHQAAAHRQFVALVDSQDSFDAAAVEPAALERLLWIRCHNADEALKAADLVLRDGNLPLVIIDFAFAPAAELRRIAAPTWYRFQRIVEERGSTCLVFTPRPMISPARTRVVLRTQFHLDALSCDAEALVESINIDVREARRGVTEEPLRRTA